MTTTPSFRLDEKVALITGAGDGIGKAIAVAFAEAGAEIILVGRRQSILDECAREIEVAGSTRPRVCPCDITDQKAVKSLVGSLANLDILVNNAGTNIPEPMADVTEEHFDRIMDLNVRGLFFASQAAVAKMRQDPARKMKGGSIVNISSQMGHVGSPNRVVYCASKHAVEGMTKAMALELAPEGIRVNAIAPTIVETSLVRRIVDTPEKREFFASRIPIGRMAKTEDLMGAVLFLASPASAMVTGTSLMVDGGWTAQ
jgi:NAD(P)-dependent dehydrogenase (short-subunit alcohol dehydrogenase family)